MDETIKEVPKDEAAEKIDKSLSHSIKDASWWSIMSGFGDSYLSAFAVFLQASPFQLSMLSSVPQLLGSSLQFFSVKLTSWFSSRKRIVLIGSTLQACMWLAILGISWWLQNVWVLIGLAALYTIFGSIGGPAWASWIGDLVPESKRGRYFGKRNRIAGFVSFLSVSGAGLLLDSISAYDTFWAFALLFTVAFGARLVSVQYLARQYEPVVELREPKKVSFLSFLRTITHNNFGMFSGFSMLMMLSVYLVSPLFILYWLKILQFSYLQYTIMVATASVMGFLTMTYWGAHADHYGNRTVLWVTSYLIAAVPLAWYLLLFAPIHLVFPFSLVINAFSGMAWAGFNLSSSNFIYDSVTPENRVRFFAYYNILRGSAIFIGGLIGGLLGSITMPATLMWIVPSGIYVAMLLSALARFLVATLFIDRIHEVKVAKHRPHFLHFVTIMPFQGIMFDSIVGMNRTLKTFKRYLQGLESRLDYWERDMSKKTKNE
jgi:MFS family permease